jgi:hypothetical protein
MTVATGAILARNKSTGRLSRRQLLRISHAVRSHEFASIYVGQSSRIVVIVGHVSCYIGGIVVLIVAVVDRTMCAR